MSFSPVSLGSLRRSAACVFTDGRVAEKQFVEISAEGDGGAIGIAVGYSVYGFENGDTLLEHFEGDWGADGYSGEYEVLSGMGRFEDASGNGTITGVASVQQQMRTLGRPSHLLLLHEALAHHLVDRRLDLVRVRAL